MFRAATSQVVVAFSGLRLFGSPPGMMALALKIDSGRTCFFFWLLLFSSGKLNLIFRFHALSNAYDFLCNDFWRVIAMGFCAGGFSLLLLFTWILVEFRFHEDSRRNFFF
uniref:(northern house mosquito) hypothetical protein n=1 Tax=Culex pipiens TaxID=7175 RepID=A0A8D8GH53_CULPI